MPPADAGARDDHRHGDVCACGVDLRIVVVMDVSARGLKVGDHVRLGVDGADVDGRFILWKVNQLHRDQFLCQGIKVFWQVRAIQVGPARGAAAHQKIWDCGLRHEKGHGRLMYSCKRPGGKSRFSSQAIDKRDAQARMRG
ncbi:hypothetical protein [Tateyamaria sp.]|uniref:hypothetical protein n=1 Tax=Tateyamaria sp. TaxID=1929288 RepID=UPI00329FCBC8